MRAPTPGDVLPAYAGMILKVGHIIPKKLSAPRIRGDDPYEISPEDHQLECSPHTRG